jgi:hypothetical protein
MTENNYDNFDQLASVALARALTGELFCKGLPATGAAEQHQFTPHSKASQVWRIGYHASVLLDADDAQTRARDSWLSASVRPASDFGSNTENNSTPSPTMSNSRLWR